ncbi:MAG: pyridoxal-phosphate dependent enzyme [Bacteroidota bacterium]|nr:pyridoxal-phosphate dependent enzyme [Bacteroidota bacterium]MDP3144417.1 pyridoxal-phosphate dependent enzyme [Bacteroidota bacterium]
MKINYNPIIQKLSSSLFEEQNLLVDVLRLDLIHPEISGNKWFKLKLNLEKAKALNFKTVITFGGAFSNHIAATASACKLEGINCIGIIRGEESQNLNSTLLKAKQDGMLLHFVDRGTYSKKTEVSFANYLLKTFGDYYLIPEGGNNDEGVLGCAEILKTEWDYDFIFIACGTAATYAGVLASAKTNQTVVGINVLKGENLLVNDALNKLQSIFTTKKFVINGNEELEKLQIENSCITNNYCFNGYANLTNELIEFKNKFEKEFNIPLDYIYTNKLFYAVFDIINKNKIRPNSKVLIIHSGGLQGNKGFEERYHLMPTL